MTRLLTLSEVAAHLGITERTCRKIAGVGELPGGVRLYKRIHYRAEAIKEFVQNGGCGRHSSQAPPAARKA